MWLVKNLNYYRRFSDFVGVFTESLEYETEAGIRSGRFDPDETFWNTFYYVIPDLFQCTDLEFFNKTGLNDCIEIIKSAEPEDLYGYSSAREAWMDVADGDDIVRIACSVIFPKIITWDENARPEDYGYEPDTWVALVD